MADATLVTELSLIDNQTAGVQKASAEMNKLGTTTTKTMDDIRKSTDGLQTSNNRVQAALQNTAKIAADLGRQFTQADVAAKGLEQGLRGVSALGVTVATALGNLIGQAVGNMMREIVQAITQFGALRNELAAVSGILGNAGNEFLFVQSVAATSNRTLGELTRTYAQLSTQAAQLGVSQNVVAAAFERYEAALARAQQQTIFGAAQQALTAIGGTITSFDRMLGLSSAIVTALNGVRNTFQFITGLLPSGTQSIGQWGANLAKVQIEMREIEASMERAAGNGRAMADLAVRLNLLKRQEADILLEIDRIMGRVLTPEQTIRRTAAMEELNRQLTHERSLLGLSRIEQEHRNRLFQTEQQFRQMGFPLSPQESADVGGRQRAANLVPEMEPFLASLRTTEQAELESHTRRLELLKQFQDARLIGEQQFNQLLGQEAFRHTMEMERIAQQTAQMRFQAMSGTMQEAQALLGLFAGKSKAAAIAAIAINKGLAIAQAAMNTSVAATRALAELGPIAGPPVAATIKAWGMAQMALIAATGLGQIAGLGGSAPGAGGGGSSSATVETPTTETAAPSRSVAIYVEAHKMISTEQMGELIDLINNEVQNGATLISTQIVQS